MFSRDDDGDYAFATKVLASFAGTGVLGVVAAGMLAVAQSASVALNVAEQHGTELSMIRGELIALRKELIERTDKRYSTRDAASHEKYAERRLAEIEKKLDKMQ